MSGHYRAAVAGRRASVKFVRQRAETLMQGGWSPGAAARCSECAMRKRKGKLTHEEQVDEIVQTLMHDNLPKSERIRLMKELVQRGEDLPDEALEEALKRLLERLLF